MAGDLSILVTLRDEASQALQGIQNAIRGLGQEATIAGGVMTAGLTAPIAALGAMGVSFANLQEKARVGFTVMLGGAAEADKMLKDLAAFAAQTPFEFRELIPQAVRLKALGFAAQEIIPILKAAGDAAALNPNASLMINRITLALGQMNTAGRVNAQDMRQLTEAGVPAWQILADAIGVTQEKTRELSEKGLIPAKFAIEALVNGIENGTANVGKLGGTMDELSKTASGAFSNLKDAADQALGALLVPILQVAAQAFLAILPHVQMFSGMLMELDSNIRIFIVGIAATLAAVGPLTVAFGGLILIVGALANPIGLLVAAFMALSVAAGVAVSAIAANFGGIRDTLASHIGPVIETARGWGSALIQAFADGMSAALDAIVAVINAITSLLAAWFMPHSPPKVAPNIDKWGTETFQMWINGFTKADFSIFNELADTVEDQLRAAFESVGGFDLFQAIMGSREGIAEAVTQIRDFGEISQDTMDRIRDAAGPVADAVERQVRLYGDLAQATREVEAAERDLQGLQRAKNEALKPYERELAAIRNQRDDIQDQQELARLGERMKKGKLAPGEQAEVALQIRERELRREMRQVQQQKDEEIDAAKDRLEAAKDVEQGYRDQIDAQKALAGVLKENVSLWNEFHKAAAGGGGGAGKGGVGGLAAGGLKLPEFKAPSKEEIKAKLDEVMKQISGAFAPLADIGPHWDAFLKSAERMIELLVPILLRIPEEVNKILDPDRWSEVEADIALLGDRIGVWLIGITKTPSFQDAVYEIGRMIGKFLIDFINATTLIAEALERIIAIMQDWISKNGPTIADISWKFARALIAGIKDGIAEEAAKVDWKQVFLNIIPAGIIGQIVAAAIANATGKGAPPSVTDPGAIASQGGPPKPPPRPAAGEPGGSAVDGQALGGWAGAGEAYLFHRDEVVAFDRPSYTYTRSGPNSVAGGGINVGNIILNPVVGRDGRLTVKELQRNVKQVVDGIAAGLRNPATLAPS